MAYREFRRTIKVEPAFAMPSVSSEQRVKPGILKKMKLDLRRVAAFIRKAETEELLDRVTVYREGMEPAALDLMEGELDRRGVSRVEIAEHDEMRRATCIMLPDGTALRCSFCDRPAEVQGRGWIKVFWGTVPILPRLFSYCEVHRKQPET